MPAEIRYRAATPRDATVVAELIATAFATYSDFAPAGWQPRNAIQEETEVYDRLNRGDVHARLALADSALAGFTGWMPASQGRPRRVIPGRAHLWSLFIDPRWWGTGLATDLLEWSVGGMRESGYDEAQLWTPEAHARARAFYEREGWRPSNIVQFSPDLDLNVILYEREL